MKLTQKLEAEILKAYNEYWNAYLKGDMQTMSYWMHDKIQMIGSGRSEFFKNKKQTLKYYKSTADQVVGKADMRNRKISIVPAGDQVLVNEECDFFVLIDSVWTFYEQGRISTLFTKTNKGWRIIQEHGSMPDARTSEGEQVNTDKIKAENIRLKDAVKRRTIELEYKNRELEIEASVERVRAKALAMHTSGEILGVVTALWKELKGLDIPGVIASAIYLKEDKDKIRLWDLTSTQELKGGIKQETDILFSLKQSDPALWVSRIWRSGKKFLIVEESDFNKVYKWVKKFISKEAADAGRKIFRTNKIRKMWFPSVKIENGRLTCDFIEPPPAEMEPILLKMGAAFDLAYKRFLDLKKAEAQTREAQIQLALERVRARSLAMHHTSELQDVVNIVAQQLHNMGLDINGGVFITLNDEVDENIPLWASSGAADYVQKAVVPFFNKPIFTHLRDAIKKRNNFFAEEYSKKEKDEMFKHLFRFAPWNSTSADRKKQLLSRKGGLARAAAISQHTSIAVTNHNGKKFSDEDIEILKRFGKVFEQSYIRFLDLQKAEAQAREAQIEVAVERIRAKALAMHQSDEIHEVVRTLRDELFGLKLQGITGATICLKQDDGRVRLWDISDVETTGRYGWDIVFDIGKIDPRLWVKRIWDSKKHFIAIEQDANDLRRTLKWLSQYDKKTAADITKLLKSNNITYGWHRAVKMAKGILITDFANEPAPEIEFILKKAGASFDLAYKRFLDLQKAEAQAREAEIELGLERVRARAMAMQHSDELAELVATVFRELNRLDFSLASCIIWIHSPSDKSNALWIASDEMNKPGRPLQIAPFYQPFFTSIIAAWKAKDPKWVFSLTGTEKKKFQKLFFKEYPELPEALRKPVRENKQITFSASFNNFGALEVVAAGPLTDDKFEILHRFGNVFNTSYTRFNDLKKAESQAREAEIELALERVRARTMAMQKSDELQETSLLLFKQMKELGETAEQNSIAIIKEDEGFVELYTTVQGHPEPKALKVPINDPHVMAKGVAGWKAKRKSLIVEFHGQELKDYNELRNSFLKTKVNFPEDNWIVNIIFFSKGWLSFSSNHKISKESSQVLERFTGVFEQTYTRFLDLQKAEAQAREAQIEAALERVRSRSMAMQKSEELQEVIKIVYEQFVLLKINVEHTGFIIDYKGSNDMHIWLADQHIVPSEVRIPYFDSQPNNSIKEAKEKEQDFFKYLLTFEEKNKFYVDLFRFVPDVPEETLEYYFNCPGLAGSGVLLDNIGLYIENFSGTPYSDEENKILMRFGKVFQQTYTRFLDLQKAEAQAKEAQIEAALEKVRSRSLAMHKSEELKEVVAVLFQKLQELEFEMDKGAALVMTFSPGSNDHTQWITDATQTYAVQFFIPFTEHAIALDQNHARKNGLSFYSKLYDQKEKNEYFKYLFQHTEYKQVPDEVKKLILESKSFGVSIAFEKNSAIAIPSTVGKLVAGDEIDILKRFAKVFEQSYTRFLDLQKAEAQAREAQIQLALERVRARTMAMHHSDELTEVVKLLYQEFDKLKISNESTDIEIGLIDDETGMAKVWAHLYLSDGTISTFTFPFAQFDEINDEFKRWKSTPVEKRNELFITTEFSGNLWEKFKELAKEVPELAEMFEALIAAKIEKWVTHNAYFSHGLLTLQGTEAYPPETQDIQKRFAKVFEQTYIRFLDLQKAEAQAREAQIETAMERIRARAMAMHTSGELIEVANVLREQMGLLNQPDLETSAVLIYNDDLETWNSWYAFRPTRDKTGKIRTGTATFSMNDCALTREIVQYFRSSINDYTLEVNGEKREEWLGVLIKAAPEIAENAISDETINYDTTYFHFSDFQGGSLLVVSYMPPSVEIKSLQRRAASVFELAYRRFRDLQKAEAQAREAQIEAALERVRSRSLAMHQSSELEEVIMVVSEQLQQLQFRFHNVSFVRYNDKKGLNFWLASPIRKHPFLIEVPYLENPVFDRPLEALKNRIDFLADVLTPEENHAWLKHLIKYSETNIFSAEDKENLLNTSGYARSLVIMKHTILVIGNYAGVPYTDEQNLILKRFANVFDQAYTRFLDLQKAEAQAREAQIEASLERIRSRSMAMQKSDELLDVISIFSEQLAKLDIHFDNVSFGVNIDDDDFKFWLAAAGQPHPIQIHVPYINNPAPNRVREAQKKGLRFFADILTRKENAQWVRHLINHSEIGSYPDKIKNYLLKSPGYARSTIILKNINLYIGNYKVKPYSEEDNKIFKRFADAFEQSYTRFLDLKKAEAQAREAEIELSLERVRARTMAMHHSDELSECAELLFSELTKLGGSLWSSGFAILQDDEQGEGEYRTTDKEGIREDVTFIPNRWDSTMEYLYDGWKQNEKYRCYDLGGEEIRQHYANMLALPKSGHVFQVVLDAGLKFPEWQQMHAAYFKQGYLLVISLDHYQHSELLIRFARVFEQTYTRFLDLQKAEAQAREGQIQLALERVRAKTMAMQKSDDLPEAANLLFHQVQSLGMPAWSAGYCIWSDNKQNVTLWMSSEGVLQPPFTAPTTEDELFIQMNVGNDQGKTLHVVEMGGEDLVAHYKYMRTLPVVGKILDSVIEAGHPLPAFQIMHYAYFSKGFLLFITYEPVPESHEIFKRFASVFDQTYTRFLDLQRAEVQARQSEIELALERVRAKVMAMTTSKDLNDTSLVFGEQLRNLGINWQFSYFWLVDESKDENTFWITWPDHKTSFTKYTIAEAEEYFNECLVAWRGGVKIHDNYVPLADVQPWLDTFQRITDEAGGVALQVMKAQNFPTGIYYYDAMMKYGSFGVLYNRPSTDEEKNIQCRFAVEFERAYTRFLDLQKAEAQAREAQIEAALERVRSRSIAMRKSEEIADIAGKIFSELRQLDLALNRVLIWTFNDIEKYTTWWSSNPEVESTAESYRIDYNEHPVFINYLQAWQQRKPIHLFTLSGDTKKTWEDHLFEHTEMSRLPVAVKKGMRGEGTLYTVSVISDYGIMMSGSFEPLSDANIDIIQRFGRVFQQSYTRYLDVQKAEAQAREAQIEAALERIRSRSLAMHQSHELKDVIAVTFEKLKELDVLYGTVGIQLFDSKTMNSIAWVGTTIQDPQMVNLPFNEQMMSEENFLKDSWLAMDNGTDIINKEYSVEQKDKYFNHLFVHNNLIQIPQQARDFLLQMKRHIVCVFPQVNSAFFVDSWNGESFSAERVNVIKRAAKVFEQAYIRFLDLKKVELQAYKAQIETALERVRARALAMQQPEELIDVAQVMRHEMGLLGVEELETSSIYINDAQTDHAECWYAIKDVRQEGTPLVTDHFYLSYNDTWVGREMQKFHQSDDKQVSILMQGDNRKEWIHYCEERSPHLKGYYGEVIPDRTYHLYKFSHGAIGAATPGNISAESWDLLQRAASAFSLAYSRFKDLTQARNDLVKLKEEKQRAETALSDLQATQKQLIQSEKMASLGELTAGIAHEIQNPLNFVNNFSDVSGELLDEMVEELAKGNVQSAKEILEDVKQNLEKINHHGKRADGIVKGMLQHSRSSSGVKEPTDINALCDEYLRLSFHGLRAKDKSFNAKFETDLDSSIGKINVVPQEIGRVVLNLINNAFYAVTERKKLNQEGYEPIVSVSTKKENGSIEVRVKDNGTGIPQKVLDKIFQPFFTTKPTGQGTGLGLSLSYDIVTKGHGGELKVETKEGEGSEFIITLPVNS